MRKADNMPRLNTYIEVGICAGYMDGDYRVSAKVADLSRNQMSELINTMFHAQRCAWDMWSRAQAQKEGFSGGLMFAEKNMDDAKG